MFNDFFSNCRLYDEAKPSKKRVSKNIAAVRSLIETEMSAMSTARKRSITRKTLIITAAAVTVLAGFTTAVVKGNHVFSFKKGNSKEQAFDLDLKSRALTIPEEFKPQNDGHFFSDSVDMTPRELFERFGITPPINDNFTDVADKKPTVEIHTQDDFTDVEFKYVLYNKAVDKNVYFETRYYSNTEKMTLHSHLGLLPGEPSEIVTLNNGASCMVSASGAVFSHDGASWEFFMHYDDSMIPRDYGELTEDEQRKIIAEIIEAMPGKEAVKQVLADMELL